MRSQSRLPSACMFVVALIVASGPAVSQAQSSGRRESDRLRVEPDRTPLPQPESVHKFGPGFRFGMTAPDFSEEGWIRTPSGGGYELDRDLPLKDGPTFGLFFRHRLSRPFGLELAVDYTELDFESSSSKWQMTTITGSFLVGGGNDRNFVYARLGFGVSLHEVSGSSASLDNAPTGVLGLGYQLGISDNAALLIDLKYQAGDTTVNSSYNDWEIAVTAFTTTVGFAWRF